MALPAEQSGNPLLTSAGANQVVSDTQAGGNMEGKEVRFGITDSALWAVDTTVTSNGSVNSFHDSYTPIGGMIPLANIALGEIAFGGVGSGLYGMLMFAIIAVFIAGLMVGRTPEYLGKKIERKEMMMAALALLIGPAVILGFSAVASVVPVAASAILNPGPHGLSEILYLYTSSNGNNGSAFAGITSNAPYYNWTGAFAMLLGRFAFLIPIMAFGGSLVKKKVVPAGLGTLPTHGLLFVSLLVGVILIVGALTYFPAYSLGPIVEHLLMHAGRCSKMQTDMRTDELEVKQWKTRRKGDISIWDPKIIRAAIPASFKKLDPRVQVKNPVMFVVEIGSVITTIEFVRLLFTAPTPAFPRTTLTYETIFVLAVAIWLWFTVVFANFAEAMAEGRGKAQAETLRRARTTTMAKRLASPDRFGNVRGGGCPGAAQGRPGAGRGRGRHPRRRRRGRGRGLGGRVGHHGRVGSRHSRERRRPQRGDGGHAGALRLDRGADQRQPRRDLPGPHDRAGGGREAAAHAQRDRAQYPDRQPDDHLRAGGGLAGAVRHLLGSTRLGHDADRAAGVPDPHHHRRFALGHRHRGHGPHGAAQRAGHERARGRGGRRRGRAAAGQDRHHHAGQPPGDTLRAAARRRGA